MGKATLSRRILEENIEFCSQRHKNEQMGRLSGSRLYVLSSSRVSVVRYFVKALPFEMFGFVSCQHCVTILIISRHNFLLFEGLRRFSNYQFSAWDPFG